MNSLLDLSTVAKLIGDPSRANILVALLNGQSLPATQLAHFAHISPQTTSAHLAKLTEGGLLKSIKQGRHKYYQLKNSDVAHAIEALTIICPKAEPPIVPKSKEYRTLSIARTCYDHLAGKLGVSLCQALLKMRLVNLDDHTYVLTEKGVKWLHSWEINENQLYKRRRKFAFPCLDWSERKFHIAGALGAAILNRLFEEGWISRISGTRALDITETGKISLFQQFDISFPNF